MSLAFLVTSLVVVVTPGTGALFTISVGIARGRRTGVVAAAGCTLGIVPHLLAATTGTAALLRVGGLAFEVLRWLGVAYLLWMAVVTWRDRSSLRPDPGSAPPSPARVVATAVLVNLLNPKLTLFFFAFLPQFVPAGGGPALAPMLGLSAVFMAMTFVVFTGYGVCAAAVREQVLGRPAAVRWARRVFALAFGGLGARLATDR